jgi:serine/threonine protein phosphatase PrpC
MGSSLVPILLIVVLLVGAVVFVVLSNRSSRAGHDPRPPAKRGRRRRRSSTFTLGATDEMSPPDEVLPGFASPSPNPPEAGGSAAGDAGTVDTDPARGGDVTAQVPPAGGGETHDRDPEATGWTPPPTGRPPTISAADSTPPRPTPAYAQPVSEVPRQGSIDAVWETPTTKVPSPTQAPEQLVAEEPPQATAPPLRLAAAGRTRRGKRGGPNEDAFVVSDGLLAVADGVGGEAAGQIASTLAVTTVAGFRPQYAADPAAGLRQAVARANRMVREKPLEQPTWRGMACTLDVVVLGRRQETGETLTVAHVGDSSVWLQPAKGRPRKLTTDHAIKNGPLLNAIGRSDEVDIDVISEAVRAGDRVVLASDGITKVMTPEQLDGLFTELGHEPPERAADALVEAALLAGARDDTTIVVADLVSEPVPR